MQISPQVSFTVKLVAELFAHQTAVPPTTFFFFEPSAGRAGLQTLLTPLSFLIVNNRAISIIFFPLSLLLFMATLWWLLLAVVHSYHPCSGSPVSQYHFSKGYGIRRGLRKAFEMPHPLSPTSCSRRKVVSMILSMT
jgi:hypothetical protein